MDVFVITITAEFTNIGTVPARLAFTGNEMYEMMDWRQGQEMRLIPGETKTVHFMRRTSAVTVMAHHLEGTFNPEIDLFDLEFWVRDLGVNVRDTFRFNADLRVFRQVGSDLKAFQAAEHSWIEDVASPIGERAYERLAEVETSER
jgi:hypothetical protein